MTGRHARHVWRHRIRIAVRVLATIGGLACAAVCACLALLSLENDAYSRATLWTVLLLTFGGATGWIVADLIDPRD